MDDKIKEYILAQTEFDAPEVQQKFDLTYGEMQAILKELEKEGKIAYASGVTYKKIDREGISESREEKLARIFGLPRKGNVVHRHDYRRDDDDFDDDEDFDEEDDFDDDDDEDDTDDADEDYEDDLKQWRERLNIEKLLFDRRYSEDKDENETFVWYAEIEKAIRAVGLKNKKGQKPEKATEVRKLVLESVVRSLRGTCKDGKYKIIFGDRVEIGFELSVDGGMMRLSDKNTLKDTKITDEQKKNFAKIFDDVVIDSDRREIYVDIDRPLQTFDALMKLYFVSNFITRKKVKKGN